MKTRGIPGPWAWLVALAAIGCGSKGSPTPQGGDAAVAAPRNGPVGPLRLGSERFRIGGQINDLEFGADGALYILDYNSGLHAMDPRTGVIELRVDPGMQVQRMARLAGGELAIVGSSTDGHAGMLAVWSPADRTLRTHAIEGGPVSDGDLEGGELLVSGRRRPLAIVSTSTGAVLETLDPNTPDWSHGRLLGGDRVIASRDAHATVLDRKTGAVVRTLAIDNMGELWPSPDGSHLIAKGPFVDGAGYPLEVWRLEDGVQVASLPGKRIDAVAWHLDGGGFYTGDEAGQLGSFRRDGTAQWEVAVDAGGIMELAVSADGLVAIGTRAGGVRIVEAATHAIRDAGDGHTGWVRRLAFVGDGLISVAADNTARSWSLDTGRERARIAIDGYTSALIDTADRRAIYAINDDVLETRDQALALIATTPLPNGPPTALGLDPGGALIAATWDSVFALDAVTGKRGPARSRHGWRNGQILPGGVVVFESDDGLVIEGGEVLETTDCGAIAVSAADPSGSWIAVADQRGDLRVWKRDGGLVGGVHLDEPHRAHGAGAIALDGSFALFGTETGVLIWERDGKTSFAEVGRRVTAIALDPGRVALGTADGRIEVWELAALRASATAVTTTPAPPPGDQAACQRKHAADSAAAIELGGYLVESDPGDSRFDEVTGGGLGRIGPAPKVSCAGSAVDLDAIVRAGGCAGGKGERALPGDDQLTLTVDSPLRVAAGKALAVPYTLRWSGDAATTFDLLHFSRSAFQPVEVRLDGTLVLPPECPILLSGEFQRARITVEPGGTITGTIPWRAANHDFGPRPLSKHCPVTSLAPGRYQITFEMFTDSTPKRRATVEVQVTR